MGHTFRSANLDILSDGENIIRLLNRFMFPDEKIPPIGPDLLVRLKRLGTARIYLCEADGRCAGVAVCFVGFSTWKQRELLNIHDLFVDEEFRGQGMGEAFLEWITEESRRQGFCRITLEVFDDNPGAIRLYERKGFIGSGKGEGNYLMYFMKKELG
jgi:GNAT superfamily N-acetyltransferase